METSFYALSSVWLFKENTIIIGTPGPFTWRGTVFTNSVPFRIKDDKRWYFGPVMEDSSPVDKYSYLGKCFKLNILA